MKHAVTILQIILLAALLVGLFFGYVFFRTWQKNERPEITTAQWQSAETQLGNTATLDITLKAPWHRELKTAVPTTHPDDLLPVAKDATLTKGQLDPNGYRTWSLTIPLVATKAAINEGLSLTIPLVRTSRISPNSVNVPLPALAISTPGEIPRDPQNPGDFLVPDPPAPEPVAEPAVTEAPFPWLLVIAASLLVLIAAFFLIRRAAQIAARPPWERALEKLDALDHREQPTIILGKLTDILKQYTAERFSLPASAKTSSEFLALVKTVDDIPPADRDELPWLARVADAAKFAGIAPPSDAGSRGLTIVRSFVENTTPKEEPDA
ncbi:MAG: hypothetical protein ACSHYF_16705 [Verrucomicrobiaceae bacterium]